MPRATEQAVEKLVSDVVAAAGRNPEKRRDVLQHHLARLTLSDEESKAWQDGLDIVGSAYERLLSGKERREAGQFFTPFWAGEVMAGWVFQEKTELAIDPGSGSGGLLIPAARHPRRRGAKLLGVDIDPLAVSMLEANTRLRGMTGIEARQGNFLLDPLEEAPGAILCNPPYSRHHAIPPSEKKRIHNGFEGRLGVRFSGLAALHVLFLVRAIEVAAEGARIAFITPSDWLDVGYGKKVKQFLLEHAQVEAIVLIDESHLFFEGVLTTAAITLIRKTETTAAPTKVLRLTSALPKPKAVLEALSSPGPAGYDEVVLSPDVKWSRPTVKRRSGTALGSVARVRRGIATGANSYFVISERQRRNLGIPVEQVKRCITSPRVFTGTELTAEMMDAFDPGVPRWLVDCSDPEASKAQTQVGRYLRKGRRLGIHLGYLAAKRKPWHRLEQRGASAILFTYFNRDAPRFVRNRCGAVPLNNWLIVEPKDGVDPDALYRSLQSKSVREQLIEGRRVYGGGLWKLEPSELIDVRVSGGRVAPR